MIPRRLLDANRPIDDLSERARRAIGEARLLRYDCQQRLAQLHRAYRAILNRRLVEANTCRLSRKMVKRRPEQPGAAIVYTDFTARMFRVLQSAISLGCDQFLADRSRGMVSEKPPQRTTGAAFSLRKRKPPGGGGLFWRRLCVRVKTRRLSAARRVRRPVPILRNSNLATALAKPTGQNIAAPPGR